MIINSACYYTCRVSGLSLVRCQLKPCLSERVAVCGVLPKVLMNVVASEIKVPHACGSRCTVLGFERASSLEHARNKVHVVVI